MIPDGCLKRLTRSSTLRKKYNISVEVLFPDSDQVEDMVREKGMNLFYDSVANRELCCKIRKVNPMNKMLATLDGWILRD